jgi:hypothetical protein
MMLRAALAACAAALVTAQVGAPVFSSVTGAWSLTALRVKSITDPPRFTVPPQAETAS